MERARRHRRHLLAHATSGRCAPSSSATRWSRCASSIRPRQRSIDAAPASSTVLPLGSADAAAGTLAGLPAARRRWWCSRIPRCWRRRRTTRRRRRRSPPARGLPAPRAAAAAGPRGVARDRDGHALGGRLRGQFKALADEIRALARRGLHGAPGGGRRAAGASGSARCCAEHELEPWPDATVWSPEGLAVRGGRVRGGLPDPRARPGRALRGGDLRGPAPPAPAAARSSAGAAIASFTDLAANDLVVHEQHGIGRYHGLRTLRPTGTTPTSCCSSTPTAAGSTCPSSGST